jgi:lipid-A-disaccharide synthase
MHGANLIRALWAAEPGLVCEGLGGRRMAAAGMTLRYDLAGQAIMGFAEVLKAFRSIRRVFLDTVDYLNRVRPACLVLIDYPGLNLRLARKAKAAGIPVVYYISPQIWAWKRGRIHTIAKVVNKMLVILPFEEALYRAVGVDCAYVGHPLLDQIAAVAPAGAFRGNLVIGLLPGSREQEISRLMGPMIATARGIQAVHRDARFIVPCVDEGRERQVRALAGDFRLETAVGKMYEVLDAARFCLVASGTATLETALFGVPMVILYKTAPLNYWIARRVVRIEHIGLVNILAGRGIVPEFIQHDASVEKMLPAALDLIGDTTRRARMEQDLAGLRSRLGGPGASARAAAEVLNVIRDARARAVA